MIKQWWQHKEKAGMLTLRLTCFLVAFLPRILLDVIVFFVSLVYYIVSKNERENVKFYLSLLNKRGIKTGFAFLNFYNFAQSIVDKILVWKGKITQHDLVIVDEHKMKNELKDAKKGHVFLVSHFGNIDVARAVSTELDWLDVTILLYSKHSANFNKFINQISVREIKILEVSELGINEMLELKRIVDSGKHIGIMGDRVPVYGDKSVSVEFLGRECEFSVGAFVLASILKCKISTFWAVKNDKKYEISFNLLADEVVLGRDKINDVIIYLRKYLDEFEKMCEKYPNQFFNFYDFWQEKK